MHDYTGLLLPSGLLQKDGVIEMLVTTEAISDDDYEQVELVGWLYQFYISEKKHAVYASKKKFRPEDIPAATQIFTPNWIVKYLVENTLGGCGWRRIPTARSARRWSTWWRMRGDGSTWREGDRQEEMFGMRGRLFGESAGAEAL